MTGEPRWCMALLAALAACCVAFPATASATPGWIAANVPLTGLDPAAGSAPHEALQAVSCPQSGSCVAVGAYSDTGGSRQGLIETLSHGKLTATTAPLTGLAPAAAGNPQIALFSLSCPVAGWCVAVGEYHDGSGTQNVFALTLSGGTWSATTLPVQGLNPAADLSNGIGVQKVTCPAKQACVAIGWYGAASGPSQGLIERLSGGGWAASTAPLAGVTDATTDQLLDVSCSSSSPSSCVAVGGTDGGGGDLVETLSGGVWAASSPSLAGLKPPAIINPFTHLPGGGSLSDVSCPSTGGCSEVGTYLDDTDATQGLIVSGGKTTAVNLTKIKPPAYTNPLFSFSGLACTTAACTGLGGYTSPSGSFTGRINSLTKLTSQTAATTALPFTGLNPPASSPPSGALQSLSCPDASNCVAVGQYGDKQGNERGIVETISTASTATTPLLTGLKPAPAANPDSTLLAVSCPPSGPCLAIGDYIDASQVLHEIVASPAPATTVTRVSPAVGPVAGGQTVTLTGTGFVAGAKVAFGAGALSPSVTFVSSHELKAVSPAHPAGTFNVQVITSGGTSPVSAADHYTYLAPPTDLTRGG